MLCKRYINKLELQLENSNNKNGWLKVGQFFLSVIIFILFVGYIWLMQESYEETTSTIFKALSFSAIVLYGSFSYDVFKRLVFMPSNQFWAFCRALRTVALRIGIIMVVIIFMTIFFHHKMYMVLVITSVFYLVFVYYISNALMKAIEVATAETNVDEAVLHNNPKNTEE